jgi:L-aspartate oxidase
MTTAADLTPAERPTVIVVGSGIAGLTAALGARATHDVTLITKSTLDDSNTRFAQGGIAAAVFPDDSPAAHTMDTLESGAGLSDEEAVRILTEEGPDRIADLLAAGVEFDRDADGELSRGLEAAHSLPRVLHAGGDATGAAIEAALVAAVRAASGARTAADAGSADAAAITVRERTFLADLLVREDDDDRDRRVVGVRVIDEAGDAHELYADAVILATGGAGQLYSHTTNPSLATGDGVAAAWRAGAEIADAEFYQFHPTALAVGSGFLVSEAVRGEGAVLRNQRGERFMVGLHPLAELAPRDVVARGIAVEMAAQGGAPVLLDATELGTEFLARRFPTISKAAAAAGLDWSKEPVPITPAAHYWMGGIRTDVWGRTSLRGLYAIGEAACTGVHGANRLASNSLLEAAVFANRAVRALGRGDWPVPSDEVLRMGPTEAEPPASASPAHPEPFSRAALQQLMWDAAGVHRSGEGLRAAGEVLSRWSAPEASAPADQVTTLEDTNLLDLARVVVASALARTESRGAHYRTDFPVPSATAIVHTITAREVPVHAH